jgi:hypothetical protein
MSTLEWKRPREERARGSFDIFEARSETGSRYRIRSRHAGFIVTCCPPKRRWWPELGTTATLKDAVALAESHNDRRATAYQEAQP